MTAADRGHRYATAAVDAVGVALVALSFAGSLYLADRTGAAAHRRGVALVGRLVPPAASWPPGRLAALAGLAAFWTMQGQFRGW